MISLVGDILGNGGGSSGQGYVVKVSRDQKKGLGVMFLESVDYSVDDITGYCSVAQCKQNCKCMYCILWF